MITVTSFSQKGYELYGRKFLESAIKHWPTDIVVYYEELPDLEHENIIYKPLKDPRLYAFLSYCDKNPVFSGVTGAGYNFNYDAVKFSKKFFAQLNAIEDFEEETVIWIDADCVVKKDVPLEFLKNLSEDKAVSLLIREGLHAESGFVIFDTFKKDFPVFMDAYRAMYQKGKIFSLPYWIDGAAIQTAVLQSGVSYKNLSIDYPACGTNVLPHSKLGEYLQHNKGNRKHEKDARQTA